MPARDSIYDAPDERSGPSLPPRLPVDEDDFESFSIDIADIDELPDPEPLIEGYLFRDSVARLVGQSGSYKSFVALDMALSVASDRAWQGRPVKQTKVVYVIGEGLSGYKKRVKAWCLANGVELSELRGQMRLTLGPVQIGQRKWSALVRWAEVKEAGFFIIDTQAKATVGYSENSNDDAGLIFDYLGALRQQHRGTILLVHHTGHANGDAADRGRGASAWKDGVDTELILVKVDDLASLLRTEKQKDIESGTVVRVALREVPEFASLVPEVSAPITAIKKDQDSPSEPINADDPPKNCHDQLADLTALLRARKAVGADPVSKNFLMSSTNGSTTSKRAAIEWLVDTKRVSITKGPNRSDLHEWAAEVLSDGSDDSPFQPTRGDETDPLAGPI